jgi:hypothetical protein
MHWTGITNTFILHIKVNREPMLALSSSTSLFNVAVMIHSLPFIGRNPRKTKS